MYWSHGSPIYSSILRSLVWPRHRFGVLGWIWCYFIPHMLRTCQEYFSRERNMDLTHLFCVFCSEKELDHLLNFFLVSMFGFSFNLSFTFWGMLYVILRHLRKMLSFLYCFFEILSKLILKQFWGKSAKVTKKRTPPKR